MKIIYSLFILFVAIAINAASISTPGGSGSNVTFTGTSTIPYAATATNALNVVDPSGTAYIYSNPVYQTNITTVVDTNNLYGWGAVTDTKYNGHFVFNGVSQFTNVATSGRVFFTNDTANIPNTRYGFEAGVDDYVSTVAGTIGNDFGQQVLLLTDTNVWVNDNGADTTLRLILGTNGYVTNIVVIYAPEITNVSKITIVSTNYPPNPANDPVFEIIGAANGGTIGYYRFAIWGDGAFGGNGSFNLIGFPNGPHPDHFLDVQKVGNYMHGILPDVPECQVVQWASPPTNRNIVYDVWNSSQIDVYGNPTTNAVTGYQLLNQWWCNGDFVFAAPLSGSIYLTNVWNLNVFTNDMTNATGWKIGPSNSANVMALKDGSVVIFPATFSSIGATFIGVASGATNATITVGTAGITNTLKLAYRIFGFTGTAVVQTNAVGRGFSRGTITVPTDITLQPGEYLIGTSCAASGVQAW